MTYFKTFSLSILCVAATFGLSACLPDANGVKENRKHDLLAIQAGGYASSLASTATAREAALLMSSAWVDGLVAPGLIGTSQDGAIAHAYCLDTSGENGAENHMMISWLTGTNASGNFVASGLGAEGGTAIVQEMAKNNSAHTFGLYKEGTIHLRGVRQSGATELEIAQDCGITIPEGAPVHVAENLQKADTSSLDTASYEYRTRTCPDGEVGVITERRQIDTAITGESTPGEWASYDSTCGGMQSVREVQITSMQGSITGAMEILSGGPSVVKSALKALVGSDDAGTAVKCATVETTDDILDSEGNVVHKKGDLIADNCEEAEEIDLTRTEALGEAVVSDEILKRKEEIRACGAGNTTNKHNGGSYSGHSGTVSVLSNPDGTLGWTGNALYIQNLYKASVDNTGSSRDEYSTTAQWGDWEGETLHCERAERLTISCASVFPQYFSNPSRYELTNDTGMVFTRTNVIDGWASKTDLVPNDPMAGDQNWKSTLAGCRWNEVVQFGCSVSGFSAQGANGLYHRPVYAAANFQQPGSGESFGDAFVGDWQSVRPLVCVNTSTTGGCSPTTTTVTMTYTLPWLQPTVTTTSSTQDNCNNDSDGGGSNSDPLIIDLGGDGLSLLDREDGIHKDIDEDGVDDVSSWAGRNEGFLVWDRNGDGIINDHSEMFGNDKIGGFDHLAENDSNGDGVINEDDDIFDELEIWVDRNSDGISQRNEIRSLKRHGITQIGLDYEKMDEKVGDNTITGKGWVETVTGTILDAFDVVFNFLKGLVS